MEHVLITGGAGYIGCVLTPMLLDRGCRVTVIDNLMYGAQGILPCFSHSNFEFLRGDVRDEEFMRNNVAQADVVIHLAAIVGYPACDKDPSLARQVNELATFSLVDIVSKNQLVIAASTGSNYGALKEGICTEETPLNPCRYMEKQKQTQRNMFLTQRIVRLLHCVLLLLLVFRHGLDWIC